ncbi:MAG: energy-coupling factor ABC transporter substrate-binding protein [Corynebacterium glucuronolyticum]|nr:energy-coupling factor ABC transporter substrate-binding protein [Corynebacterium glucuronolyticum]MDD7586786.1 energy-coupling factor ABC transporter substrate-binding protein [Mycobacteriaceae bacterium]MDY5833433.1 energy-coupling factor ABC transporter substrate-binding protein [Corynebacterium glucuronolyticum]
MKTRNLIISIIAIIFLVVLPFFVAGGDADFGGADDKGGDLIEQENPGYEPWFEWQPELPGEVESGLFALQAALGAGFVGYALGFYKGRRKNTVEAQAATAAGNGSLKTVS